MRRPTMRRTPMSLATRIAGLVALLVALGALAHFARLTTDSESAAEWAARLRAMRAAGLNGVTTYVPWSAHVPRAHVAPLGLDALESFVRLAEAEGLLVTLRVGFALTSHARHAVYPLTEPRRAYRLLRPYICAEYSGGGLPHWLPREAVLRSRDPLFIKEVSAWFGHLLPVVRRLLFSRGGPIVLVQLENEYGNYAYDKEYMKILRALAVAHGLVQDGALLITADGAHIDSQTAGGLDGILRTTTLRKNVPRGLNELRTVQTWGPLMASEVWIGWFDSWHSPVHYTRGTDDVVATLRELLDAGASFNLYMFAGGNNGVRGGALMASDPENKAERHFRAHTSSYDYDAPISESGELTPKYYAIRNIIREYYPESIDDSVLERVPQPQIMVPHEPLKPVAKASLLDFMFAARLLQREKSVNLTAGSERLIGQVHSIKPLPFEDKNIDIDHGFVLYRTILPIAGRKTKLKLQGIHDRAFVFVNGQLQGVVTRSVHHKESQIQIDIPQRGVLLEILVEDLGRINYGAELGESKGIIGHVIAGRHFVVLGWQHLALRIEDVGIIPAVKSFLGPFNAEEAAAANAANLGYFADRPHTARLTTPTFFRFDLYATSSARGVYLDLDGWERGYVWINDRLISRYWPISGPQRTVFIPGSYLRAGTNEVTLLELSGASDFRLGFANHHKLGPPAPLPVW